MPITATNISKNVITPTAIDKGLSALWDSATANWDDSLYVWSGDESYTNVSKNTTTPINITKN